MLAALCEPVGCDIAPLRRLSDLSIDASGLRALGETGYYLLGVTVRNRGRVAVQAPALELTLSDLQGKVVARRVLTPQDLGRTQGLIPPNSEWPAQVGLSTGGQRIHSYAIDVFYP